MRAVLTALLSAVWLAACSPSTRTETAAPEPALWRIADADSEIWLFGTAHLLPQGVNWRGPRFQAAFGAAEELVIETDPDTAATQGAALATRYGLMPQGQTLDAWLEPASRTQLTRVAQRLNVPPQSLQQLRPWRAALTLSFSYARTQGLASDQGVEVALLQDARRRNLHISYLETAEQQIRTLADLPRADETRFLTSTLQEIDSGEAVLDKTDDAWASGDTRALWRLLEPQTKAAGPEVYAALITRRNVTWVGEIQRRLQGRGRIFIAVGAAHLVGPDSVVALLRTRGVTVEGP